MLNKRVPSQLRDRKLSTRICNLHPGGIPPPVDSVSQMPERITLGYALPKETAGRLVDVAGLDPFCSTTFHSPLECLQVYCYTTTPL